MARKSKAPQSDNAYNEDAPQVKKKFHQKDLTKIQPKTKNQKIYFEEWDSEENSHFFLCGSAGTGKTFLSFYLALDELLSTQNTVYDSIIVVRSTVPTRDMGFLPGNEDEKMAVYEEPYASICDELFPWKKSYENLKKLNKIRFLSSSFIRGTTFNNSIIIVDECQNMNWEELNTIMTRVGRDSKIIFCGDLKQNDLTKSKYDVSGFNKFYEVIVNMKEQFCMIEFTRDDIVRSKLVKDYIITCEKLGY